MENFGKKAKDKVSGLTGIVVSKHIFKNGCVQYGIQGKIDKDGVVPDIEHVDEDDITILKTGGIKKEEAKPTGGGERSYPN